MRYLFLLPLLPLLLLLALGALIAWLVIGLVIMMFELLCWMLSVPLEWLWQRRVEPVASISGHLLAVLGLRVGLRGNGVRASFLVAYANRSAFADLRCCRVRRCLFTRSNRMAVLVSTSDAAGVFLEFWVGGTRRFWRFLATACSSLLISDGFILSGRRHHTQTSVPSRGPRKKGVGKMGNDHDTLEEVQRLYTEVRKVSEKNLAAAEKVDEFIQRASAMNIRFQQMEIRCEQTYKRLDEHLRSGTVA